jgi:hypothetical protein
MKKMLEVMCVVVVLGLVLNGCNRKRKEATPPTKEGQSATEKTSPVIHSKEKATQQATQQIARQDQQVPTKGIQGTAHKTNQVQLTAQSEQALWNSADKEGAIESYQRFLEKCPNSSHAQQAKGAIDKLLLLADNLKTTKKRTKYMFGGDIDSPMIVTITTKEEGKRDISCPLASQEEAISIGSEPEVIAPEIVTVMSYLGYPFAVKTLGVDNSKMFYYTNTITIKDVQSGIIIPSSKSPVPMQVDVSSGDLKITLWTQAINMVWEFAKPGISIDTGKRTFISEESGAQILFTRYGIELNKVKVIEK